MSNNIQKLNRVKIFGLSQLGRKIPDLLRKKVTNRNQPSTWTWKPNKPEKIKNLGEELSKERSAVSYSVMTNYVPSKRTQKVFLFFAAGNLSYGLVKNLEKSGLKFFFLDFLQFILKGKITFRIEDGVQKCFLRVEDAELDLKDVSAVLWTPPKFPNPLLDFESIPAKRGRNQYLFKKRWVQILKDLYVITKDHSTWIPGSPLTGSQEWQNKIGEFAIAKYLGFQIPPILVTNDKSELMEFVQTHGSKLLLRELSCSPFSFPPVKVDVAKVNLSNLEKSPCCFQKYIDKKYEYRVVVLFDKVYPCRIYSQDSELAKDDWRVHDDGNVKWELAELPEEMNQKLRTLREKLGLNWCSVDLIQSKDDRYYFLEANRPGAHYWLDLFVGLDITKEIVSELEARELVEKT